MKQFIISCVYAKGPDIRKMVDKASDITAKTFKKHIGAEAYRELEDQFGYGSWLRLKDDYAVSFHKSIYKGRSCVYMNHSMIEYIFQEV